MIFGNRKTKAWQLQSNFQVIIAITKVPLQETLWKNLLKKILKMNIEMQTANKKIYEV